MAKDNTTRFSNRVEDYVKYRPGYPSEMRTYLQTVFDVTTDKIIADIGSGTGISSDYFLHAGYSVIGVEPNAEMRNKSEALLNHYASFSVSPGTAEETQLSDSSVDVIIAGQAFHWFDVEKCKKEFKRILKGSGPLVLFWNERLTASAFEIAYDQLIVDHAIDYVKVDHRNVDLKSIQKFFSPETCELKVFPNQQIFNDEGLQGRLLSSSYMPQKGDAGYEAMIKDLKTLFESYQENNEIQINYATKVYVGYLK
jgi:SAM-dependent methyltransferase